MQVMQQQESDEVFKCWLPKMLFALRSPLCKSLFLYLLLLHVFTYLLSLSPSSSHGENIIFWNFTLLNFAIVLYTMKEVKYNLLNSQS